MRLLLAILFGFAAALPLPAPTPDDPHWDGAQVFGNTTCDIFTECDATGHCQTYEICEPDPADNAYGESSYDYDNATSTSP